MVRLVLSILHRNRLDCVRKRVLGHVYVKFDQDQVEFDHGHVEFDHVVEFDQPRSSSTYHLIVCVRFLLKRLVWLVKACFDFWLWKTLVELDFDL
jgi:hypothetical protein